MGQLAIKRLTGSDLTLFEWQFRNRNAGNQKSINLNADVFIGRLFPALPNTDEGRNGRVPLDMFLYGPGNAKAWNLQRKIIKGGSYKNWRLNGEYITNPDDAPDRFNSLSPGDYAIFDFEGDVIPKVARIVFVAAAASEDANLHRGITDFGVASMRAIDLPELRVIAHTSGTPETHPVYELLLDAAIEDAAQNGIAGTQRLLSRGSGRRLTRSELERARKRADDIGRLGEEFLDGHFAVERDASRIQEYDWVAIENAISPFDFWLHPLNAVKRKIEVKSTTGDFKQIIHISMSELIAMRDSAEPYDIYRIYGLDEQTAKLRVAENLKDFATSVIRTLEALPSGVTADGISVKPDTLPFGPERVVELPSSNDFLEDE